MRVGLTASRLVAARGGETIVGPLDFTLAAGEAMVVTGENGTGKSTLLRTVAGLLPAGGGTVSIEGAFASDGEPARHVAEAAHYLGHRNAMKGNVSVGDNLAFWGAFLGPKPRSVEAALEAVGLPGVAGSPFSYLSAGQQRRASIARLLVVRRPVWILDEPTSALDARSQGLFAELAAAHLRDGGIVIAATHQPLGLAARELRLERRESSAGLASEALAATEGWL